MANEILYKELYETRFIRSSIMKLMYTVKYETIGFVPGLDDEADLSPASALFATF